MGSRPTVHLLAVATAVATYLLILLGGLVHGTGSSLACPDWPLCYGSFLPEMQGGVAIEHTHRLAAGAVALLILGLAVLCTRHRIAYPRLWRVAWLAVGLVVVQALLGGATVLLRLPTTVSTLHTGVSMLFLLAVLHLAVQSRAGAGARPILDRTARRAALVAGIAVLFQVILGGLVRHSGAALACLDLPLCRGSFWPEAYVTVHVHVLHRLAAILVAGLVVAASWLACRAAVGRPGLRALALAPLALLGAQIFLGVRSVQTLLDLATVEAHLAVGTALLVALWLLYLCFAPAGGAPSSENDTGLLSFARDLVHLTKPRVTTLVMVTFAGGLALAPGAVEWWRAVMTFLGTTCIVAAANVLNMYFEREVDGSMERTRQRPLPTGRLAPEAALALGTVLACAATPLLLLGGNLVTGLLGLGAFLMYVWVYTPLKRHSSAALFVGAIPGAVPPLMGWTVATGRLDARGLALGAVLFLWQIPHFLAIVLYRHDDYVRAGFRVLPIERGERFTLLVILATSLLLVAATALLAPLEVAGRPFAVVAMLLGAAFVAWSAAGLRRSVTPRPWARSLFFASVAYLALLFAALAIDRQLI